jgi:hypothetical protein
MCGSLPLRYLQLLPATDSNGQYHSTNAAPFSFILPKLSTLRDVLDAYVELLQFRLGVCLHASN